jgi:FkbM family methyltransferase
LKPWFPKSILRICGQLKNKVNTRSRRLVRDFSQSGETQVIRRLMKPFPERDFVEVGANDGISLSATFGLVVDGWRGLSIEANPTVFRLLQQNLSPYPDAEVLCLAVSPVTGRVKLYLGKNDANGFFSTISTDDSPWYREHRSAEFVEVDSEPLTRILYSHGIEHRFGLLLVDAEGMDLEVLQTLDFGLFRPRLIVTEDYEAKNEPKFSLLRGADYRFIERVGCNTFWIDKRDPWTCSPLSVSGNNVSGSDVTPSPNKTGRAT